MSRQFFVDIRPNSLSMRYSIRVVFFFFGYIVNVLVKVRFTPHCDAKVFGVCEPAYCSVVDVFWDYVGCVSAAK